jgi:hypothetical protein
MLGAHERRSVDSPVNLFLKAVARLRTSTQRVVVRPAIPANAGLRRSAHA